VRGEQVEDGADGLEDGVLVEGRRVVVPAEGRREPTAVGVAQQPAQVEHARLGAALVADEGPGLRGSRQTGVLREDLEQRGGAREALASSASEVAGTTSTAGAKSSPLSLPLAAASTSVTRSFWPAESSRARSEPSP
jgi:hypothetical protein